MRSFLLRSIAATTTLTALLAACSSGTVPNQVLTKPAPATAPPPVARAAGPWLYHASAQRQQFSVDQRATITIRLDSAARTDTVSTHAEVSFTAAQVTNGVSGTVNTFRVQNGGGAAVVPAGITVPFPVRGEYSARASQLDFTTPHESASCASAALSVTQSLRDLWFRPPDTLRVGTTWQDSASYVVCRDGIPLRAASHRSFRVTGTVERDGRLLLTIARTSSTTIDGNGAQFGETVSVGGAASGQIAYELDPATGEVGSAVGNATLDLTVRSRLRTQIVRQVADVRLSRN